MSINTDIPDEFCAEVFPDYVRIATANAVIGAQYVERVLNAICLILNTDGLRFSVEDFMSGDATRTRQTLGMIEKQLRDTDMFEPSFSQRLVGFSRRRNRVVHGLFADCFRSREEINIDSPKVQEYVKECEWIAGEAALLVEIGFGIYRAFGEVLLTSKSNDPELVERLSGFDEFYEVGLSAVAHKFRPHLASHDASPGT